MELHPHLNLSLEDMPNEIWKPVNGYEGLYEVSSLGRVKTVERIVPWLTRSHKRKTNRLLPSKIRASQISVRGYGRIQLSRNNVNIIFSVHRLVAEAFIPNIEKKPFINHINSNRNDNRIENLEWCTSKENSIHRVKFGKVLKTQRKISEDIKIEIINLFEKGLSRYKISAATNNPISTVYNIINNHLKPKQ